jgi:hypothetical protein
VLLVEPFEMPAGLADCEVPFFVLVVLWFIAVTTISEVVVSVAAKITVVSANFTVERVHAPILFTFVLSFPLEPLLMLKYPLPLLPYP